jgi:hypothetical protein
MCGLVVRVGVLSYIVIGREPRTPFSAALGLTAALGFLVHVSVLCVLHFQVKCVCVCACSNIPLFLLSLFISLSLSLSLGLSLLFTRLPALRDIYEAPCHIAVLKNPPACDATRLRRLESSRIALLFWGGLACGVVRWRSAYGMSNAIKQTMLVSAHTYI